MMSDDITAWKCWQKLPDDLIFENIHNIEMHFLQVREGLASNILAGLEGASLLYLVTDEERMDRRQQLCAELQSLEAVMVKLKGVSTAGGLFGSTNQGTRHDGF